MLDVGNWMIATCENLVLKDRVILWESLNLRFQPEPGFKGFAVSLEFDADKPAAFLGKGSVQRIDIEAFD